ncbi:hypothetical protein LTR35_001791 [Friedmanniomyces endolithicus]|uniref:Helicase ATP-binding domain-containing protein n=1 Tax=Friedmanniomyces endolithicus TaxID=329885 RepID=A0AAN6JIB1_9PEZI|nr:hypothetical protein LTR35_001791 [Friedmanniomyces endolithicus]KAK0296877.1 hypothetical protein LTS00_004677 [Friedmanniomyces endolithicus]KAK0325403.1 hypothetical protein LTR82_003686 [Friedmanniomyces endolithicus]KAK1011126.1 hypothetical protein LTR54_005044 [Friedmanniomyces endolithicus]
MGDLTSAHLRTIREELQEFANQIAASPTYGTPPRTDIAGFIASGEGLLSCLDDGSSQPKKKKRKPNERGGGEGDSDAYPSDGSGIAGEDEAGETEAGEGGGGDADADAFDEPKLLAFLNDIGRLIRLKHNAPPLGKEHLEVLARQAHPHQRKGAGFLHQAGAGRFKGAILADPPGLGKSLTALLAALAARQSGDGPILIVVPASCAYQWMQEIGKAFKHGTFNSLHLKDGSVSPFDLSRYDIVVATYNYVASERSRISKYLKAVAAYEKKETLVVPRRPRVTLLSEIFGMDGKPMGRTLILDEVHAIKNFRGKTYAAIFELRCRYIQCFMLSGTPLDNTWRDVYALLTLLRGHPIELPIHLLLAFTNYDGFMENKRHLAVPRGNYLLRIIRLMDAVTIRRPPQIAGLALPLCTLEVVEFTLPDRDVETSNDHFIEYKKASGAKNKGTGSSKSNKSNKMMGWKSLTLAEQWAYHPRLPDILSLVRKSMKSGMNGGNESGDALKLTDEEQTQLDEWRRMLRQDGNWRSARVDVIADLVDKLRDLQPDVGIVIMADSTYFLDVVQAAMEEMYQPLHCCRFDGRKGPAVRHQALATFAEHRGPKVMLASRGAGGQGLNMQSANVLIRCGPWWKVSWEEQAVGRVHRQGQTKAVQVFELNAKGCAVEKARMDIRQQKDETIQRIVRPITRADNAQMPYIGRFS